MLPLFDIIFIEFPRMMTDCGKTGTEQFPQLIVGIACTYPIHAIIINADDILRFIMPFLNLNGLNSQFYLRT
jgi:hypothetical protein